MLINTSVAQSISWFNSFFIIYGVFDYFLTITMPLVAPVMRMILFIFSQLLVLEYYVYYLCAKILKKCVMSKKNR